MARASHSTFTWAGWTKLAALATTVGVLGGLYFTNRSLEANNKQYELSKQSQITERYAKAVEELSPSNSTEVELGGIFLLERLVHDSPPDSVAIYNELSAFIRDQSPNSDTCGGGINGNAGRFHGKVPKIEIQSALTVIMKRDPSFSGVIDLSETCLAWADLRGADLQNVILHGSNLHGANLGHATFWNLSPFLKSPEESPLQGQIELEDADDSQQGDVNFDRANMEYANLHGAFLARDRLDGVDLVAADLSGAIIIGALMCQAKPAASNLTDALIFASNISDTDFEQSIISNRTTFDTLLYNDHTVWPKGVQIPPSHNSNPVPKCESDW